MYEQDRGNEEDHEHHCLPWMAAPIDEKQCYRKQSQRKEDTHDRHHADKIPGFSILNNGLTFANAAARTNPHLWAVFHTP